MNEQQKKAILSELNDLQNRIDRLYATVAQMVTTGSEESQADGNDLVSFRSADPGKREQEFNGLIARLRQGYFNPDGTILHMDKFDWIRDLQEEGVPVAAVKKKIGHWISEQGLITRDQKRTIASQPQKQGSMF